VNARPLHAITSTLERRKIAYALVGAAARNAWAPPRLTADLDLAVIVDALEHARLGRDDEGGGGDGETLRRRCDQASCGKAPQTVPV